MRCFYGGPRDIPPKGVFSLAALTSVHLVSVRVSVRFRLSIQPTDLPKVSSLDQPKVSSLDLPKASLFMNKALVLLDGIRSTI
jgi:hypothetical protein